MQSVTRESVRCSSSTQHQQQGLRSARCSAHACARAARISNAARLAPIRRRASFTAAAAAVEDSYDGYDDGFSATSTYEDAYNPVDARNFILERSGMVDYYQLLCVWLVCWDVCVCVGGGAASVWLKSCADGQPGQRHDSAVMMPPCTDR